ncbi:hypothetical protein OXT66_08455 [Lentilactobacillus senioris]|uniref:hypothetical protein n=1 Tax=Lentilactobacillus senioris TaxID=931534 RepID=UPI0022811E81|nr:hypothetical protein [Lentilactobacillus senioris]MCY9807564.1 hypothetical protein [Lentilactobacillus senioris]
MPGSFVFINTNPISNMVLSMGVTTADYVNGLEQLPENIVLLQDDENSANGYNSHSRFNLVSGANEVRHYLLAKSTDPKKFIDFNDVDGLNSLMASEIAELLYLTHMGTPMNRPFSSKLLNQYIYLEQGDGTVRSYYRRFSAFNHVLEISIKRNLRDSHNSRRVFLRPLAIKDIDRPILLDLITKGNDGLFILFDALNERRKIYRIPLLAPKDPDQAAMILRTQSITENAEIIGNLMYNIQTSQWDLEWTHKN